MLTGKTEKAMAPTPVVLPGKSHGQRSLVGCSLWGREESARLSDFTFTFHFHALEKEMTTHSSVCLENPRDGRARWPAVYGVAQSRTPERLHFHFHRKEWSIVLGNTFNSGMECQGNRGPIETDTILVHVEWNAKRF